MIPLAISSPLQRAALALVRASAIALLALWVLMASGLHGAVGATAEASPSHAVAPLQMPAEGLTASSVSWADIELDHVGVDLASAPLPMVSVQTAAAAPWLSARVWSDRTTPPPQRPPRLA